MPKGRVSALPNSHPSPQLRGAPGPKLAPVANRRLLPKHRVVSSNLITRSSLKNRGFLRGNPFLFSQGKESIRGT
jgi:hypothetical protein